MTVMAAFSALALGLAVVGLHGLVTYLVQLRTRDIGVRMAMGASPSRVRREVLASGLTPAAIGVLIGSACFLGLARLAWTSVPGIGPVGPLQLMGLGAALTVVAGAASWIPAHRATRIDPTIALRHE